MQISPPDFLNMPKKRSTLFKRIGKSNWFTRVNYRGETVKVQGQGKAETRNKIIRKVRVWWFEVENLGYETARGIRENIRYAKKHFKIADNKRFEDVRPISDGTIRLYDEQGREIEERDTTPDNYFVVYRDMFNRNYERISKKEIRFEYVEKPLAQMFLPFGKTRGKHAKGNARKTA